MSCLDENLLLDLSSGRLTAEREAEVEAHVDGCASCRRLLTEWIRALPGGGRAPEPRQLGRYQVLEPLGEGAMGVVYAAHDPQLNRRVCVKVLRQSAAPPDAQRRLVREAQALARLAHPNVVAVHDVGEWEGRTFIAMELIDGKTLAAWLAETPRGWRAVLAQFEQAGRGLAAAHAAGLVHRDFKPENVLVAADGRVRVTDFGLARLDADADARSTEPAATIDITAAGALVGTPAYMAPEQLRGEGADARTDQFGFCVALYSALYGQRPFAGDTLAALTAEVLAGRMREVRSGVPARIGRVLARGLAARPDDRHPSMDALLRALLPVSSPWKVPAAMGAAVAAAALLWAVLRPAPCTGSAEAVGAVWNPARKERIRAAFEAAAPLYGKASFAASVEVLDRYAAGWAQMHGEACRATRVVGDQTEAAMDLRMGCLARRLAGLQALVTQLESARPAVVERSVEASAGLAPLAFCADVESLSAIIPPPALPETRARVDAIRAELGGDLEKVRAAAATAQSLGYPPIEADAFLALGRLEKVAGGIKAAEESLHHACEAAEAGRHQEAKVDAWLDLAALQGVTLSRFADGHRSAAMARAALKTQTAGAGPRAARLLAVEGAIAFSEGKYADALAGADGAIAALTQLPTPEPIELARALNDRGNALGALVRFDEAEAAYRQALVHFESRLGPHHPSVARATDNLARLLERRERLDEAITLHRRAIQTLEAAVGPDHPDLAIFRNNLGIALKEAGQVGPALVEYRRALAIWEKSLGTDNPKLANALNNIAIVLELQGDYEGALAQHQRALSIRRAALAADHPKIAESLVNLGLLYVQMKRFPEALASNEAALEIDEKNLGPEHPDLGDELTGIGLIHLQLGAPARAIPFLERAVRLRAKSPDARVALGEATFALAQALWRAGDDRPRARTLATDALALFKTDAAKGAEVRTWLAHPR